MADHKAVREGFRAAWRQRAAAGKLSPAEPPEQALQAIQAISWFESNYGNPSNPPQWKGSHNLGAIHHPTHPFPPCPPDAFEWRDYDPRQKKLVPFCFQTFPDFVSGANAYLKILLKPRTLQAILTSNDADIIALAMYDDSYFVGMKEPGNPDERRKVNSHDYARGIDRAARTVAPAVGEPLMVEARGGFVPPIPRPPGGGPRPPAPPPPAAPPPSSSSSGAVLLLLAVPLAALVLSRRR